jgi:hypothetical protein
MDWFKLPILILILGLPTCSPIDFQAGPLPPIQDGGSDDSTDSQTDTIEDSGTDGDSDSDTDVDSDTDTGPDTGTETDTESETGSDTDTDVDTDTDTDTDTDSDTDTDTDTEIPDPCTGPGTWLDDGWWFDFLPDYPGGDMTYLGTRCWQDPPAPELMEWTAAVDYCADLVLAGYDDWILPDVNQLRWLGRPTTWECADCGLIAPDHLAESDIEDCEACLPLFGGAGAGGCYWDPALGGTCSYYWSSSEQSGYPLNRVWGWSFAGNDPGLVASNKTGSLGYTRCVRSL